MNAAEPSKLQKLRSNLPWLARYPFVRGKTLLGQNLFEKKRIIISIADHFEPSWSVDGLLPIDEQRRRLDKYARMAEETGNAIIDHDGTKFRHTNFYPAEQYDDHILDRMAAMQNDGLGEVEIHLHHGVEKPDTSGALRKSLIEFRDILAERHKCLSRWDGVGLPKYAFVHGNLALGNSCDGLYCGVDDEMQILQETGCYADMTLPSAPDRTQVAKFNSIYECGGDLTKAVPHAHGRDVEVGQQIETLPLIINGPLILKMISGSERLRPGIEDGALTAAQGSSMRRFARWVSAGVTVKGRPDWIFVKLYCHGFFDHDQSASIGEDAVRFFNEMIETGERSGEYTVHFASAREMFNIILAAIDRRSGDPGQYRDHRLRSIMSEGREIAAAV